MRIRMLTLLAFAVFLLVPAAANAALPLTDEVLGNGPSDGTVAVRCDPAGVSTVRWDISGSAFGPYPGTFREIGRATVGPQTIPGFPFSTGPLLSFHAAFRIDSPAGRVTGTKKLAASSQVFVAPVGQCFVDGPNAGHVSVIAHQGQLRYRAVIAAEESVCVTSGTAEGGLNGADGRGGLDEFFDTTDSLQCHGG